MHRKRPLQDKPSEAEPKRKKKRKHRPGFDEEIFSETSYYIRNGLRYVKPYYFSFVSHAKGRWVGSRVFDVFCREFQAEKPEFYEKAILTGKVTVNSEVATMETVLQNNDLLSHRVHRHEPPVTAQPIKILYQNSDIVAVDKPSSIPVHPCGRYRHNSVVFLLGKEHNLRNLHTVHRLDRLTSGLLLFARTLTKAQQLVQQIQERKVAKEYVCKVHGKFPDEPVECSEPILVVSHKLGICRVAPDGKTCSTSFTRLSYDGHTSILKCVPKTGRMHQIRVHLQWLGYPIVNDPLYGHPAWGPMKGCKGEGIGNMDEVISKIVESNYNSEEAVTTTAEEPSDTSLPVSTLGGSEVERVERSQPEELAVEECVREGMVSGGGVVMGEEGRVEEDEVRGIVRKTESSQGHTPQMSSEGNTESNEEKQKVVKREEHVCEDQRQVEPNQTASPDAVPFRTPCDDIIVCDNESVRDPDCTECSLVHPDPTPDQLIMYLHALRYTGPDWQYSTELPSWASGVKHHTVELE